MTRHNQSRHRHGNDGGGGGNNDSNAEWRTRLYFQTPLRKHNGDIRLLTIEPPQSRKHGAPSANGDLTTDVSSDDDTTASTATLSCFLRLDNIVKNSPKFTAISRCPYSRRGNESGSSSNDEDKDDDEAEEGNHTSPPTATATATTVIMVNGGPVPVPHDLAAALEHLRRDGYGNHDASDDAEPVLVWVAELCVNGADPAERSVQAAQTAAIFAGASRTLAWLGAFPSPLAGKGGGGDVCEAMEALKSLSAADQQQQQGQGGNVGAGAKTLASHTARDARNGWLSWGAPTAVGSQLAKGARSVAAGMAGAVMIAASGGGGSGNGGGNGEEGKGDGEATQADNQEQPAQAPLHERLDSLRAPLRAILNHPYWTRAWSLVELAAAATPSSVEIGVTCEGDGNLHRRHRHTTIELVQFHATVKALDAVLNNATVARWLASRTTAGTGTTRTGSAREMLATSEPADVAARSPALRMLAERAFHARYLVLLRRQGSWSRIVNPWSYVPSSSHQPQPPSATPSAPASTPYSEPGHDLLSLLIRYFYHHHQQPPEQVSSTLAFDGGGGGGGGGGVGDPRDTLYALLNLASDAAELGQLVPDYAKSWARVRAETSAALLRCSARPLALCVGVGGAAAAAAAAAAGDHDDHGDGDDDDESLQQTPSSWMLDWTTTTTTTTTATGPDLGLAAAAAPIAHPALAGLQGSLNFKACGPADDRFYRAEVEVDGDGDGDGGSATGGAPVSVVVKGAIVGAVKGVGEALLPSLPGTTTAVPADSNDAAVATDTETSSSSTQRATLDRYRAYLADIGRLWEEALSHSKSPYAPEQSKVALAKISIADAEVASSSIGGGGGGSSTADNVAAAVAHVHRATSLSFEGYQWLVSALATPGGGTVAEEEVAGSELLRHRYQGYLESLDRSAATGRRRPFLTDSGYVGTGPPDLEPGDAIAVPYGSPVPVALRPSGEGGGEGGGGEERVAGGRGRGRGGFKVVGAVYVFGIMDGEFMKVHRKEAILRLS